MSSNPSAATGRRRPLNGPGSLPPSDLWTLVQSAFLRMADEQRRRLEGEIEIFNLDEVGLDGMIQALSEGPPERNLELFRKANPDLDPLHPHKLQTMDPYALAVGVVKMFSPDHLGEERLP